MLIDLKNYLSIIYRSAVEILEETSEAALVLDLDGLRNLTGSELAGLKAWCQHQPCPLVGVGDERSPATECVDVVVESAAELTTILRRIKSNPQASTVLVQVLRAIEQLSPVDGLVVESLGYGTLQAGGEFKRWLKQFREKNTAPPAKECGPAVIVERVGDQLNVKLNRPESSNSYTVELRDALFEALKLAELDDSIKSTYVSANGRCFCTGGELTEFGSVENSAAAHMIRSQRFPAKILLSAPERYHFHVHKACIGSGLELPACAGRLTASPKTTFWLPELSMGLIPGAGGCVSITKRIGRRKTAYMVMMNKKIDAHKALEWGLVDEICS